jgi:CRP/FNR family nitrogen fixation transcriptional regulator
MLSQTSLPIATTSNAIQDPDVRALLAESQPGAASFYPTNAVIYAQGDEVGPLYLVEFGTVRVCQLTADGRRQITSFYYAGDVFGLEAGEEHAFYAESVDGAGIRVLRAANGANFAQRLLSVAVRRFVQSQTHMMLLGRMTANEKVAHFLLDLLDRQDSDGVIHLPMQRNDIADYLGMTFETVSRVLRVLKDRAIIRVNSVDRIDVLHADDLAEIA